MSFRRRAIISAGNLTENLKLSVFFNVNEFGIIDENDNPNITIKIVAPSISNSPLFSQTISEISTTYIDFYIPYGINYYLDIDQNDYYYYTINQNFYFGQYYTAGQPIRDIGAICFELKLVWVPILHHSSGAISRPSFTLTSSNYGEMGTLKNKGSVIYGIRGYTKNIGSNYTTIDQRINLSNGSYIKYSCARGANKTFYAYIYNSSGTRITSKKDGYWTYIIDSPVSISSICNPISLIYDNSTISGILTRPTIYKSITGKTYPSN